MAGQQREDVFRHYTEAYAFSRHFREMRIASGMTQEELAFEAGVDRSTVARIEACRQNITLDVIFAFAKALKVHPKLLFDFEV